jgi:hypothetical protein
VHARLRILVRLAAAACFAVAGTCASAHIALDVRQFSFLSDVAAPHAFIRFRRGEVLLPVDASNCQLVSDTSGKLAAVSYHVTSDYDSVAVVAEAGDSLFILPDIWRQLEDSARALHLIPNSRFDHTYIRAVALRRGTLECTFSAHGVGTTFACRFFVDVTADESKIDLHLQPAKTPNHAMQPTAGRRTTKLFMIPTSHPATIRVLASGGSSCSR